MSSLVSDLKEKLRRQAEFERQRQAQAQKAEQAKNKRAAQVRAEEQARKAERPSRAPGAPRLDDDSPEKDPLRNAVAPPPTAALREIAEKSGVKLEPGTDATPDPRYRGWVAQPVDGQPEFAKEFESVTKLAEEKPGGKWSLLHHPEQGVMARYAPPTQNGQPGADPVDSPPLPLAVVTKRQETDAGVAFGSKSGDGVPSVESRASQLVDQLLPSDASEEQRQRAYALAESKLAEYEQRDPSADLTRAYLRRDLAAEKLPVRNEPYLSKVVTAVDAVLSPEVTPDERRDAYQIALDLGGNHQTPDIGDALVKRFDDVGLPLNPYIANMPESGGRRLEMLNDEEVLRGESAALSGPQLNKQLAFSTVLHDPRPNQLQLSNLSTDQVPSQLESQSFADARALSKLSPEDQVKYLELLEPQGMSEPINTTALSKLLLEGKLTSSRDTRTEKTLLDHLGELRNPETPLAEGIDRQELVRDLVWELAEPASIDQGFRGTCAPTTLLIDLARRMPAEYARIASELASSEGVTTLKSGLAVHREEGTEKNDGSKRTVTQRLMGSAFMEVANGRKKYLNSDGSGDGSTPYQLDVLAEALHGKKFGVHRVGWLDRGRGLELIREKISSNKLAAVSLRWDKGGDDHKVLVTGESFEGGRPNIEYINPFGRTERMDLEEFQKRLESVNYENA